MAPPRGWADADFYEDLGVRPDASDEGVARAYRDLAKRLHPDVPGTPPESIERFKRVAAAYEVLGDPSSRAAYDEMRRGLDAGRAAPGVPRPGGGVAVAPPGVRWTARRAWSTLVAGALVTILGIVAAFVTLSIQRSSAEERERTLPAVATRVEIAGEPYVQFETADGTLVRAPEPERVNPGVPGGTVTIRYDPDEPVRVLTDESTLARDVTFWIVAVKLLLGGPVFAVLGWRRLRVLRAPGGASSSPASHTPRAAVATGAR